MAVIPYMPLYISDYLADAAHLTTLEHGAYMLLLMTYWQSGKPLRSLNERLANVARMSNEDWMTVRPAIAEFFDEVDGFWVHKRVEAELSKFREKSEKSRAAGLASAQRRSNGRSTDVQRTFNHTDTDTDTYTEKNLNTLAQSDESLHASKPELLSSPQSLTPLGTIPLVDGSQFAYTQADVSAWTEAYPAVDVLQQLREMREWSRANPKNRKTKSGIRRFVTQWLAKEQDRGKPAAATPRFQAGLSPPSTQPDDGTVASEYWQAVRDKRPEQFEREAPVWIKQALRKEAGRGTQDDIRGKAGMAERANAAEEPAVQGISACMAEAPA